MASTYFSVGDVVVASAHASAQGFEPGARFEVRDLDVQPTPFGSFVTYFLAPVGAPSGADLLRAGNAHLLFSKASAGAEVA